MLQFQLDNTKIYCGIYKIENLINHKKYIGQSINIYQRWLKHLSESKNLTNPSPLYKAFRKYGIQNFSFEVIEECENNQDLLNQKEIYWIDYYDSLVNGYNIAFGGSNNGYTCFRIIKDKNIILEIRKRKLNGENFSDVYKDYTDINTNTFKGIWEGRTYSEILPEGYTAEKVEEAKKIAKRHESAKRKNSKMTEELVLQIRTDKKNGMTRKEGYQKYKEYFKSLGGFDSIWYNQRWKEIQPSTTIEEDEYDE